MAHMDTLTAKQEAAVQEYLLCGNRSEAYRRAYDASPDCKPETIWVEACKLFTHPKVSQRVMELQEEARERNMVSIESITQEYEEARQKAMNDGQAAAMVSATTGKAKLHGLFIEKQDVKHGGRVEFDINTVFNVVGIEP